MNNINQKQNEEKILKYLFVQRVLYAKSKEIGNITLFISIFFYSIGVIPYFSENFKNETLVITTLGIISVLIMKSLNKNKKEKAVDYQEYVDRTLFEFKIDKKIIPSLNKLEDEANEIILKNREKYQKSIDPNYKYRVYNWYTDVSNLPLDISRVVCQNENIRWENRQRQLYSKVIIGVVLVLLCISCSKVYKYNEPLVNLLYVVPIVLEFWEMLKENKAVIKAIGEAQNIISDLYLNIENKKQRYNKKKFKDESITVQENIRKYRLNNISIPEFLYKRMKEKEQLKSNDFMAMRVREILNNM